MISLEEREGAIETVRNTFIHHPQADAVLEAFDDLYLYGARGNTSWCLIVCGSPGTGKTATAHAWMARHPTLRARPCDIRPVAYTKLSSGAVTQRQISGDLLSAFEDPSPLPYRATAGELTQLVCRRAKQQQTRVLIVDEANRLAMMQHRTRNPCDDMKAMMNDITCGVALVGSHELLDAIDSNESLGRRKQSMKLLRPYEWNQTEDRVAFRNFLTDFDAELSWFERAGFGEYELAYAIHRATRGRVGYVNNLLAVATGFALKAGASQIDRSLLARAYDEFDVRDDYRKRNPFRANEA